MLNRVTDRCIGGFYWFMGGSPSPYTEAYSRYPVLRNSSYFVNCTWKVMT